MLHLLSDTTGAQSRSCSPVCGGGPGGGTDHSTGTETLTQSGGGTGETAGRLPEIMRTLGSPHRIFSAMKLNISAPSPPRLMSHV
ncbi:hypothetical protein PBY51_023056 [Eleginops maclovinus]|uniref:Uncharacterized protein n=1 Tax=Eleginops maclovinus TaxID=56733 RepID=A0AAN7X1I3_ELEMC|nr:hypothetical protein PBY51_023056 [Eleginops maclovinus]